MKKECILYDRECINCGECDMCDLNPKKVCDNCGICIDMDDDYSTVDVDLTFDETGEPELLSYEELFPEKAFIGEDFSEDDDFYENEEIEDYCEDDNDLQSDFGEFFG